jgi:hypothetical protein
MAGSGLIVIMLFFGLAGGIVGRTKGSSFWMWFTISFAIPFFGLLAAILHRNERAELRRQCPGCGRVIRLHDAVCTRCGEELEFPDVAISSELARARAAAARRESAGSTAPSAGASSR